MESIRTSAVELFCRNSQLINAVGYFSRRASSCKKRIILGHLNINSIRTKFDLLVDQIKGNVDIMGISETKFDESFPSGQFKIPVPGYA